jgi:proteasome activator subunit 4
MSGTSTPETPLKSPSSNSFNTLFSRSRERTFPYAKLLPYQTESLQEVQDNLRIILENLYVSVSSGDFSPGVVHWTRELRGWMGLKFDMPKDVRVALVQLYYDLALAPGLDNALSERFASTFMVLTK